MCYIDINRNNHPIDFGLAKIPNTTAGIGEQLSHLTITILVIICLVDDYHDDSRNDKMAYLQGVKLIQKQNNKYKVLGVGINK